MYYGYARVSSRDQNEDRQLIALNKFAEEQAPDKNIIIYTDKQSGKDFNRKAYRKLCRRLKAHDVLVVTSIDRLGRNYSEILEEWRTLTKRKECHIVVLDMPLLDTRSNKDLTGTLIADIVLELLSYVAETERAFIRKRQAEGIAAARERGVKFGRAAIQKPADFEEVLALYREGKISTRKAGERMGVSHTTFIKWVKATA